MASAFPECSKFCRLLDGKVDKAYFIDLESIQHKLSSDYGLNMSFPSRFTYIDGPSFYPYKPLQNVLFERSGNTQFFFRNCTHILTRTPG